MWVPKARYATQAEAKIALGRNKAMRVYKCKASTIGEHFHLGH